jgi:transcriptional regulator GlxA family with amidase domain
VNFGIVVFDQVEELDFVGPWEIVGMWGKVAGGPEARLIVAETTGPVTCAKGLSVNPHVAFDQCPPLDVLLVPGGRGTRTQVATPALLDFVSQQARRCRAVLSVCTGAFLLHAAGLLAGKRATTHWGSLGRLRALGDVEVVEELFVRDGNVWSAAGVSAGIDMALAFIAAEAGDESAGRVQLAAEYYPSASRYGGPAVLAQRPAYAR